MGVAYSCKVRGCYFPVALTFFSRLYKAAYDGASLADPTIFSGLRTPLRMLVLLASRLAPNADGGVVRFVSPIRGVEEFHFRWANTQFHSVFFDRFRYCYEPEVTAVIQAVLGSCLGSKPKESFWDIGANWGHFVGVASAIPGFEGQIVAVEPNKRVVRDLKSFIKAAKVNSRTIVISEAFGESSQVRKLVIPDNLHSGIGELAQPGVRGAGELVKVEVPDCMVLPRPTLVKVDVEGSEAEVLKGMISTLKDSKCFVMFESFYGADRRSTLEPYAVLKELGYRFYQVAYVVKQQSVDGENVPFVDLDVSFLEHDSHNRFALRPKLNVLAIHEDRVDEFMRLFEEYCFKNPISY